MGMPVMGKSQTQENKKFLNGNEQSTDILNESVTQ